ncbi:MAG: RNA-binding domain-containing protein [Nitrososphaerota archaeon]
MFMLDMRIDKMLLQVLCHATEDEEKVMKAVENVVRFDRMSKMKIVTQVLKGYYGDPLAMIRFEVLDPDTSLEIVKDIFSRLSEYERHDLIENCIEGGRHGGKLYIRLDKQAAYNGVLRLSDKDPIRIEVAVRGEVNKLVNMLNIHSKEDI